MPGGACDAAPGAPGGSQTRGERNSFELELQGLRQQRWRPGAELLLTKREHCSFGFAPCLTV